MPKQNLTTAIVIGLMTGTLACVATDPDTEVDEEIARELTTRLANHPDVAASDPIEVHVHGGTVFLDGTVTTVDAFRRVSDLAWETPGVVDVENFTELDPAACSPRAADRVRATLDAKLGDVSHRIEIEEHDDVLILRGALRSEKLCAYATKLASADANKPVESELECGRGY